MFLVGKRKGDNMKNVAVKTTAIALLCAVIMLCLSACDKEKNVNVSTSRIAGVIMEKLAMKDMVELTREQAALRYAVDFDILNDQTVYVNANGSKADEVAVFELSDGIETSPVLAAVNDRSSQKLRAYKDLSPAEYTKVKKAFSIQVGNDVVYVVSENAYLLEECFEY